jgi:4-azaleucine resistance transporter AzlC
MRSLWRTLDRGTARDIVLVCLADSILGASFGAVCVSDHLSVWAPIALSLLVFAGGSQFAAVGVAAAGGSPIAAAIAGLVLNTRMLPYGFAVPDALGGRWWTRLVGAHVLTDESLAFAIRQPDRQRRSAAFWTCGLALFTCWNIAVVIGVLVAGMIKNTDALGLDAEFPTVMLALVLPSLADKGTRNAALAGAVIAVAATPFLPAGVPVLLSLAGLVLAGRRPGRPRPEAGRGEAAPDAEAAAAGGAC